MVKRLFFKKKREFSCLTIGSTAKRRQSSPLPQDTRHGFSAGLAKSPQPSPLTPNETPVWRAPDSQGPFLCHVTHSGMRHTPGCATRPGGAGLALVGCTLKNSVTTCDKLRNLHAKYGTMHWGERFLGPFFFLVGLSEEPLSWPIFVFCCRRIPSPERPLSWPIFVFCFPLPFPSTPFHYFPL